MIDTNRNIQYKNKVNLNYKQKPLWGVVVGGDNLYIYIDLKGYGGPHLQSGWKT